MISYFFEVEAG